MFATQLVAICVLSALGVAGQTYYSVPEVDAPELAHRGDYQVGVRTLDISNPGQVNILAFDKSTGRAPLYDRPLTIEVWYPASIPEGAREHTIYRSAMPGQADHRPPDVPDSFQIAGKALRDAAPLEGKRFPLVVVSHGYPGSRTFLTYLTENLASKGYVVAAIDHTDSVFGAVKAFTSTLLNRAADQLFTIEALSRKLENIDTAAVAIIGYSMGGYGALASAGAPYSTTGAAFKVVPGGYMKRWREHRPPENLKAIVAIAPWGAQPPYNNWDDEGLAGLRIPSLFIVGDQDDISGYEQGVKRLFDGAINSERWMLVYENARHNTGGNPPPPEALGDFTTRESFDEPVWRKDRIAAINQHFITALLDLHLKGGASRRAYLDVPVRRSNDGDWPIKRGESTGGRYSDGSSYWKGFQRRWAVGLQMHRYRAGDAAN